MKSGVFMDLKGCPRVLRDFLAYHETIKGQSSRTVAEYYLDLRMFLRFMVMIRSDMPYDTDLNTISIKNVDLEFIKGITLEDVYDFFSYLSDDRIYHPETHHPGQGIENAARARKKALCICTVSDHLITGEATSAEERQTTFTKMMDVAFAVVTNLK